MKPNNVTRLLDQRKIAYTAHEIPAEKLGAVQAAQILGVSISSVYKTIVVKREGKGKPFLVVVPGDREIDLKSLAAAVSEKKVILPTEREAESITGLQAGGISPLALINKGFQVILDESARDLKEIYISGGQRGLNICLAPDVILKLTGGKYAQVCR